MKENCLKQYGKYTILNVLGMIGLSCYILADTYFVALGLGSSGLGLKSCHSRIQPDPRNRYDAWNGRGDKIFDGKKPGHTEKGNQIFSNVIFMAGGFAVLFILLGLFASSGITRLLGGTEETFEMCRTYLRGVLLICSPAFMMNNIILCFVRNDGEPQRSMAAMLAGSFSNIILDYIFIFPFHMGMLGAVVATSLAPVISLVCLHRFL